MTEAVPLTHSLEDLPADAQVSAPTVVGRGFRTLEQFAVTLRHADGSAAHMSRDALRVGSVVGVLPIDPARGEVVLIRQFRLAAHLRLGRGDMVEIVAGYVEPGEHPVAAARRECLEEIGVSPTAMRELFRLMPAPGMLDEEATIFVAAVDAARVPAQAGSADEIEHTQPIRVPIPTAVTALNEGRIHNGYLLVALQWLALNRERVADLLKP